MCSAEHYEEMKQLYLLEKYRVDSFKDWPFDNNSPCSIAKMAAAGFYWTGNKRENDTATCFVCGKTLDGWEADDDPWKEHLKHAPQCDFVKLGCAEKDLTVEQFLRIFDTVCKNKIRADITAIKTQMVKEGHELLDKFSKK